MREKKDFSGLAEAPEQRKKLFKELERVIWKERLIEPNLSQANLNPNTELEKNTPLFFGMGGGNHEMSKALPFDALGLILTTEKLKKELSLSSCSILLADQTTSLINGFSEKKVNNLMMGTKELLEISLTSFGFEKDWNVFLESELEKDINLGFKNEYEKIAQDALCLGLNDYCARETTATIMFLQPLAGGGIKIGWSAPNTDLDETFFDNQTKEYLKHKDIPNKITFIYTPAGVRLLPGKTGQLERVAPYICTQPENRILLSPLEDPVEKIKEATQKGGGLNWRWSQKLFSGIIQLFEELVLGKEITVSEERSFKGQKTAEKIAFINSYIFQNWENEAEQIWKKSFPQAL